MAVELATGYVNLVASARGIGRSIEDELGSPIEQAARTAGDKAGRSFSQRFQASAGDLTDFGKKGLAATAVLSAGLFGAAKAASSLEAAIAANEQVLGTSSRAVQEWAKGSVEAVGLSERAAVEASTGFGQLAKVAGETGEGVSAFSIEMVQLAADMAAFKDVPVDQALADLQSGFAGSTEVMRKYAIFLDEGSLKNAYFRETGEQVTGTLTAQQRVIATHAEIMRQSTDMQGQWSRESEGMAAQTAKAKAEIENAGAALGEVLIPAASTAIGWVADLAGGFAELNESSNGAVGQMLAIGTAGLGVASSLAVVAGKVGGLVDKIGGMSSMSKSAIGVLGGLAVAATAAYAGYLAFTSEQREISRRAGEVADALADQVTETIRSGEAATSAAVGLASLNKALASTGDDGAKLTRAMTTLGVSTEDTIATLTALQDDPLAALRALALQAGATAEEADKLAQKVADSDEPFWGTAEANLWLTEQLKTTGKAMEELQDQAEKTDLDKVLRPAILDLAAASGEASLKLLEQAEATTGLSRSGSDLLPLYDEFTRLLAEQPDLLVETTTATVELGEEQTATAESTDLVAAALKRQDAAASLAEDALDALSDAFDRLLGASLNMEQANQALIEGTEAITAAVEEHGQTLDINTEAGRANRDVVLEQVENIVAMGEALVRSGYANETAATYVQGLTDNLIGQLEQLGFTREEAEDYIATLGLTPENITTAVEFAGQETAKARVEDLIDRLGELPESVQTEVAALIDDGSYAEAERLLTNLERQRNVSFTIAVRGGLESVRSAAGRFVPGGSNITSTLGETSGRAGDEVVLPLGDQDRMATLMQIPGVGDRIAAALLGRGTTTAPADLSPVTVDRASGPLFGDVHISSEVELDGLFRQAKFHLVGV